MHENAPNGYFSHNLIVYGDLVRGGVVARGFRLIPPDLRGSSEALKLDLDERLAKFFATLDSNQRAQFRWRCSADYSAELAAYGNETEQLAKNPAERATRQNIHRHLTAKVAAEEVRRAELILFISSKVAPASSPLISTPAATRRHYELLLQQLNIQFEVNLQMLRAVFGAEVRIAPMTDLDHFIYYWRVLNPARDQLEKEAIEPLFRPDLSIQENCWHGDIEGTASAGFHLDSHYHAILALKRLGRQVFIGMIHHLTDLPMQHYEIVANIEPGDVDATINEEERRTATLAAEEMEKSSASRRARIEKLEQRVTKLTRGATRPLTVRFTVRVWARTETDLVSSVTLVKNAFTAMKGAQYYEQSLRASSRKLFFSTWPGWSFSTYGAWRLRLLSDDSSPLLPFTASFLGALDGAEALFEGSERQIVGVKTSVGGMPQNAVVIGASRSGKSVFIDSLNHQIGPYFDFHCIVEEGESHTRYAAAHGCPTIQLHPDGSVVFNYLDTGGLPLTRLQLSFATSLASHMASTHKNPATHERNSSRISSYILQLYQDSFDSWGKKHPGKLAQVQREALAIFRWHQAHAAPDFDAVDSFRTIRDGLAAQDPVIASFAAALADSDIIRFAREVSTKRLVMEHAFSHYRPDEYPQHSSLVESMQFNPLPEHPREEVQDLATLLRNWTAHEGQFGRLFDGVTNVALTGRVALFELGKLESQNSQVKSAVALLITNRVRQHIVSLPRKARKCIIFEELARWLDVPDAPRLVEETYAQFPKLNVLVVSIIQQYAKFRDLPIRPIIIGNAKLFFILRQYDRKEIQDLAADISLPDSMVEAIRHYEAVEHQPAGEKFTKICYFNPTAQPPIAGTIKHRLIA